MCYNKITRPSALALLLLASLATIVLQPNGSAKPQLAPRVDQWEETIKGFEARDLKNPPPKGGVLLVGGSNARRWAAVSDTFPEHPILNRGFGGARLTEVLHFADRIIVPYEPSLIFVNAGGNDLTAGSTPEQVGETAAALVASVRAQLPDTRLCFIGLPYVERAFDRPQARSLINRYNRQLAALAKTHEGVDFIDLVPEFLGDNGAFRPELFVEDGTHFSPAGYQILARLMQPTLER